MSSNVPATQGPSMSVATFAREKVELIKATVAKEATDAELELFMYQAQRTGLDPLAKQLYFMKYKGQVSIQTSIDGFRLIAERTGLYEGQGATEWCGPDGIWHDVWLGKAPPAAAKSTVYRKGWAHPITAVARYESYVQTRSDGKVNHFWTTMPDVMLAKCSESLALRKTFPQELSNLYTTSEMGQAQNEQDSAKSENIMSPEAKRERDDAPPASMVRRGNGGSKPDGVGWATWSDNAHKAFWAKANEMNLSGNGIHHEFGVESMKSYVGTMHDARAILDILDYGINKVAVGLQGIWAALGVAAVHEWKGSPQEATAAIDTWTETQAVGVQEQGELV